MSDVFFLLDNAAQKAHNTKIPVGEWFHYGFSLNRSEKTAKIYLNGLEVVKQDDPYSNFNTFDGDFYIGSNAYADQISWLSNFKGTIDDLRLYNSAIKEWGMEYLYDQKAFQKVHSGINRNTKYHGTLEV